jgi:hypothetical protein
MRDRPKALDPLDARAQRVSKSQPVTMMANLEEMSRVLYSHEWARVQDWVTALDQLTTLTDDEIAALVQAARPPASLIYRTMKCPTELLDPRQGLEPQGGCACRDRSHVAECGADRARVHGAAAAAPADGR